MRLPWLQKFNQQNSLCVPENGGHNLCCWMLHLELFKGCWKRAFPDHQDLLCIWCIEMDIGLISSNHGVKEGSGIISNPKVSTRSHQCIIFIIKALEEVLRHLFTLQLVVLSQLFRHPLGCNFSKILFAHYSMNRWFNNPNSTGSFGLSRPSLRIKASTAWPTPYHTYLISLVKHLSFRVK